MHSSESPGIDELAQRLQQPAVARRKRHYKLAALCIILLLLLSALAWPFVRAHLQSIAVLDLVAGKPVPALLRRIITEPISTQDITLLTSNGPIRARLYTPQNHPDAPAIAVLHGVHHLGMDEPRLIAFASAMSSCGVRVLTPELPDIKDYHVGANSIATIGDSAKWMAERSGNKPVGVMGLSFSGGLALLAASDPQWHPSIKFVVAIGSQAEMARVATFYRTGEDPLPNGASERLAPHEYGALVLEYEHLEDFIPTNQSASLAPIRAVLRAHLYEDSAAEKSALAALTPAQVALAHQLLDTTSPFTRAQLAHAETLHIEDMAGVSPHGHLKQLTTPVYLLHGAGDNIIPSAETEWMATELPAASLQAELISPVLSHINLDGANPTAIDQWRLVHFFALILHAAESR
jgi:dienelactone hydrolase